MAQRAKARKATSRNGSAPRSSSTTRNGSSKSSGSAKRGGAAKRSTSQRAGASSSRAKPNATRTRAKSTAAKSRSTKSRSSAKVANGSGSITEAAVERTKAAGGTISQFAARARTPLIAGGTALVGAAAGAVVKGRLSAKRSKGPLGRLGSGIGKPKLNLGKVDLDMVKSAADRISAYGQQASDIAGAVEKTRKKNG